MSYPQGGQYQQPSPRQGYYDQDGQWHQPAQNGGYHSHYYGQAPDALHHYPYPSQSGLGQYVQGGGTGEGGGGGGGGDDSGGGAVQQPGQTAYTYQGQYQDPPLLSYGGRSGEIQQHQDQHQQPDFHPQDHHHPSQPLPQSHPPSYNPAAYAGFSQYLYQQQGHNPAAYTDAPGHSSTGPVDPFAYEQPSNMTPSAYSQSSYSAQQPQYSSQSSAQSFHHSPPLDQYSPQPPAHQYNYHPPQSPPPPPHTHYRYSQSLPPLPTTSQEQSAPYPTDPPRVLTGSTSWSRLPASSLVSASGASGDPTWMPSPPAYQVSATHSSANAHASSSSPSSTATPGPTPPAHGLRANNSLRHPHERPLPPQPDISPDYFSSPSNGHTYPEQSDNDPNQDLFDDILNMTQGGSGPRSPTIPTSQIHFALPTQSITRDSRRNGTVNGRVYPGIRGHEPSYSSDSDVEGSRGLAMMQAAEEADWQGSGGYMSFGDSPAPNRTLPTQATDESDGEDYGNVDMSSFGGGYDVQMAYGGDPAQLAVGGEANGLSSQTSSIRELNPSQSSQPSYGSCECGSEPAHPFAPLNSAARVEVGGTGGLSEPSGQVRRQSYDEGDEYSLMENQLPDRFPDEPPEIFFKAATSSYPSRPLPAVPPGEDQSSYIQNSLKELSLISGQSYSDGPGAYMVNAQGQYVPRSSSLMSHSNTPLITHPLRSKTDADDRRTRQLQGRASVYGSLNASPSSASVLVDLPAIGRRFAPSKLGGPDFNKCSEPWSLMSLLKWLVQVTNADHTTDLKEVDVKEALVALFTNKVPTMNIADAEALSNRVAEDMYQANVLVMTEEWVKINPGPISGVIFQLTQSGCYSPTVHGYVIPNMRCYSHLCQRTLKKVNPQAAATRTDESWATFYHLAKEDVDGRDKKEIERQNVLHEIVTSEEKYMRDLDVLRLLYRDRLTQIEPSVIGPKWKDKFVQEVFGRVEGLKKANEEHLLPQLKYRQQEQGPWIVGFSDIFRQWVRKAKFAYIDFANDFPKADHLVRQELERNLEFRNFASRAQNDKRSEKHPLDNFLKAPIARLQRYTLLLNTVLKLMILDSQEKTNLLIAAEEVRTVTLECDARVAEMQRRIDLLDLQRRLVLRPGMQNEVELSLDQFGRQLIHRGDLQRMGSNRFTWLDCHALLFDHYLVLAKSVAQRVNEGIKAERYDVSRLPIPMDLLILDNANEPPVQKSSYIKGLTSVKEAATGGRTLSEPLITSRAAMNSSPAPGSLTSVNTAASSTSIHTITTLSEGKDSDRILYPFRIKHLGRETFTLFALTEQARKEWTSKIIEAKTKHAAALYAQNAEPFKLRVMADSAFVYDAFAGSGKGVIIKGTPIDRAIKEVELRFRDTGRPAPICRARVNCATTFMAPASNIPMVAVGTDFGVYISEKSNSRGWIKAIPMQRVTQIAVLEDFNLFLLISDKALIAYHLDVVCHNESSGLTRTNDSARKAPQKLSGSKDVGFFAAGKMKDRTLVFYKKKENLNSVFKVLEPVYQKSTEKKRAGIFKRGNTEFFREYDEFYIPTECTGITLFHSSLAVSTTRGFEVLTLDKKQPWSVPELRAEHVQNIAQHIKDQRAISMLRLSDQEFLLCYGTCAVYVNKHGDVSRSVIMNFVGNAQNAALYGPFLVLFNEDFVEIRNAQNGILKQIIAGREIKCLDDGTNWSANMPASATATNGTDQVTGRTLKLVMQHPEQEKNQIVVELLLHENMKE